MEAIGLTLTHDDAKTSMWFSIKLGQILKIGRKKSCDFVLNHAGVSNIHCEISLIEEDEKGSRRRLVAYDTSSNGTGIRQLSQVWSRVKKRSAEEEPTLLLDGAELLLPLCLKANKSQDKEEDGTDHRIKLSVELSLPELSESQQPITLKSLREQKPQAPPEPPPPPPGPPPQPVKSTPRGTLGNPRHTAAPSNKNEPDPPPPPASSPPSSDSPGTPPPRKAADSPSASPARKHKKRKRKTKQTIVVTRGERSRDRDRSETPSRNPPPPPPRRANWPPDDWRANSPPRGRNANLRGRSRSRSNDRRRNGRRGDSRRGSRR